MAGKIKWDSLEKELATYYSEEGRLAVPVRTIVGLLLHKQIYNKGDETVMEGCQEDPCWQHFTGEIHIQYRFLFDPSDFVNFLKRIGEKGMTRILQESLHLFSKEELKPAVKGVQIDTTIQEKNITFPTDRNLYEKVITYCIRIAEKEGIKLKRIYLREIRKLRNALRLNHHPRNHKKKVKLEKRFYHLAVKTYNDFLDQVEPLTEARNDLLDLMYRILIQKREESDKVYTIHKPEVYCIAKGKDTKSMRLGIREVLSTREKEGLLLEPWPLRGIIPLTDIR